MPSSPLKWNPYAKSEVQQVFGLPYGTKRKSDDESQQTLSDCLPNQLSENCQPSDAMMTEECLSQTQNEATPLGQHSVMSALQTPAAAQNNNTHQHPARSTYDMDMVMNINGDDEAMDDYNSAYDAMEGEGAVDPSQYGRSASVLHEQYCFGKEQSPNSGKVRCYCVPAWDTLMDNKAFYSDIY